MSRDDKEDPSETSVFLPDQDHLEECPICTEMYNSTTHKQSLLNCNHVFCDKCIKTIVNTANRANLCRVTCPICRQTTPVLEWEIHRMQEQMMDNVGHYNQPVLITPEPVVRRPGLCGALEYQFQKKFQTDQRFLFPPCFKYPIGFINRLGGLERRCRWLYLCVLALLLCVEILSFFLVFLPILIFVLFIVFVR
ncbi:ring finger protein-like [Spea bombifrons]|uniref:ring finger protein-like n=1 Tax=Spea bombifrons TaxID=233779 RepID=UPI00234946F4|nr:ring finger protein-like [Spea bombifrons]